MELYHLDVLKGQKHWWFAGKENLIKGWIRGKRTLNVGCGLDTYTTHGIDNDRKVVKLNPIAKWGDAHKIPYKNNYFDTVILADVLEHVDKDEKALNESLRVLKKGGRLIITVPAHKILYSDYDKSIGHKRRYNMADLFSLLSKSKIIITIIKLSYWNFFAYIPIRILFAINPDFPRFRKTWKPLNYLLTKLLYFENWLLSKYDLPFGTTIFGVFEK